MVGMATQNYGYEKVDPISWTFKQSHSCLFSFWLLLVKPINSIEIEFMPVYNPNEAERNDPLLYAKNVQIKMAKKLNLFPSDDTYNDYIEKNKYD